jgi:hypothetical protein
MLTGLKTSGSRSSEFLVTILNVIAQIALAWSGTISDGTAAKLGVVGTIAYILSRGLAKYETRTVVAAPGQPVAAPVVQPAPPPPVQ